MLTYPDLDPVALALGPIHIHWYGLMYLLGFAAAWGLARYRTRKPQSVMTAAQVDDLIFYCIIGTIVGGRLGYMLFYGQAQLLDDPLSLLRIWQGGMSFHGGLLGVIAAMLWFAYQHKLRFFAIADFAAPLVPPALFAGRLGNFINGELWGHPTTLPWGMQLPCGRFPEYCGELAEWSVPLHPSQLYEALLEGVVLFVVLWLFSRQPRPLMAVSGAFLLLYGFFRIVVEFARTPDAHIGYLALGWVTMGQLLSLPMVLAGALLLALAYRHRLNKKAKVAAE